MSRGSASKVLQLRQVTSHGWKVTTIHSVGNNQLSLFVDGRRSIDRQWVYAQRGKDMEMALSTLLLYIREYGVLDFKGQALDYLFEKRLISERQYEDQKGFIAEIDAKYGDAAKHSISEDAGE